MRCVSGCGCKEVLFNGTGFEAARASSFASDARPDIADVRGSLAPPLPLRIKVNFSNIRSQWLCQRYGVRNTLLDWPKEVAQKNVLRSRTPPSPAYSGSLHRTIIDIDETVKMRASAPPAAGRACVPSAQRGGAVPRSRPAAALRTAAALLAPIAVAAARGSVEQRHAAAAVAALDPGGGAERRRVAALCFARLLA